MTNEEQKMINPSGKGKPIAPIGPCKDVSFLASQGPTKLTNPHYLQMVHEQKADAIVMLTRLEETVANGRLILLLFFSIARNFFLSKFLIYNSYITFL